MFRRSASLPLSGDALRASSGALGGGNVFLNADMVRLFYIICQVNA